MTILPFCLISLLGFVKKMITTVRHEYCRNIKRKEYSPFGNTRARNIFKDFWFGENINDPNEVTKVFVLSPTIAPFLECVEDYNLYYC